MSLFNFNDPLTKALSTIAEEILTEKVVTEDEVTDEDAGDFTIAAAAAKKAGKKKFKFGGKEYPVTIKSDIKTEEAELDEAMKITHVVIDTADDDKVVSMASDEKGAKSSIVSAELPPMSIKDKKTLKIVKLKKPAGQKAADMLIGRPLKEETLDEAPQAKWEVTIGKKSYVVTARNTAEADKKAKKLAADDNNNGVGGKIERMAEQAEALEELTAAEKKLIDQMYDKKGDLTPLGKKVMAAGSNASKLSPKDKDADNARRKEYKAHQKANRNEEVELAKEETIAKLSNARLKYHATKGFPHGSYSNAEIKDEHKRRMKSEPNYNAVKPSLSEEDEITEAKADYDIKHKTFSSAIQHAVEVAAKQGYEVDPDDYDRKVAMGPKKPSSGKTNSYSIKLSKNGKEQKKALQVQIANLDNKSYELNMYIQ